MKISYLFAKYLNLSTVNETKVSLIILKVSATQCYRSFIRLNALNCIDLKYLISYQYCIEPIFKKKMMGRSETNHA